MTFNFVESTICDSNLIIFSERSALEGAIFSDSAVSKWKIDFSRSPRPIGLVMQGFVRSHVGTMDHVLDLVLLQSLFCNCPQGMLFRASARFTIWLIPSLYHTGCIFSADILQTDEDYWPKGLGYQRSHSSVTDFAKATVFESVRILIWTKSCYDPYLHTYRRHHTAICSLRQPQGASMKPRNRILQSEYSRW